MLARHTDLGDVVQNDCKKHFVRLHRLLRQADFRQALSCLIDRRSGRVRPPFTCDLNHAWYVHGLIRFRQRRYRDALYSFDKAYKHERADWQALMAAANCYDQLRKPKLAERRLRKAVGLQPKSAELHYNLGNALFDLGRNSEAISEYREAQRLPGKVKRAARKNEQVALTAKSTAARRDRCSHATRSPL